MNLGAILVDPAWFAGGLFSMVRLKCVSTRFDLQEP
jgi:hypothetical protein